MNNGAFGENFPYTNFHDLNLDWIIKEIKENRKTIDDFKTELEQMQVDINEFREYIDSLDSVIQEKIDEEIPEAVEMAVNNPTFIRQVTQQVRKRRIIMIGDSYGAGWTPDGDVVGYPTVLKNLMSIPDSDFFQANKGGARFGSPQYNEYAFDTVLTNLLPTVTNKETITDIIFAGGYNEGASSVSEISAGIARCQQIIDNNFEKQSINVYLCSIGYNCSSPAQREALHHRYMYCYARSGWAYLPMEKTICYQPWWASDGYHPLQFAQNAIAYAMMSMLNGSGTNLNMPDASEFAPTTGISMTLFSQFTENYFDCFLFGQNIHFDTPITINRSTPVKVLEITSNYPLATTADNSKLLKFNIPAIVEMGGSSYRERTLTFFLKQENRTTYGLYANVFAMNDNNTNYAEFTNVTGLQFLTNAFHIQIPYLF